MTFIVQSENTTYKFDTVVAPTGCYREGSGRIVRDGSAAPEMGPIQNAYHFRTHRAAARVASKLAYPIIRKREGEHVQRTGR